ncbi:diguanylate cyclase (GGDEF) domain-containing protein [Colwellia chukchiensis]|uniref:Diguanylate cyclase (GGDEF) domain-containing protein n=1 Tax=Colwellia chukchiensis TaxID=641665 RepID=A0A1H7SUY1_9GAMM|nr:bifunctional diguanylate cyclase/phosphodiesterase [Colwellia chukchiensis]SEL76381.1 diguanylate cyclase (GGDEF) domain-containing protein [Colwellia chukchiensis]
MTSLLNTLANALEQIVLEVTDIEASTVLWLDGDSDWANEIFPEAKSQSAFTISQESAFLFDFLIDAKAIWQQQDNKKLRSGLWTEVTTQGVELHLEAIAIKQASRNLLVICNQHESFNIQQQTKQVAREVLLSYDRLFLKSEYLHTRLLSILNQPSAENSQILTATAKIIENAEFAVIVASYDFNTSIENAAALRLFSQDKPLHKTQSRPIDIILTLMKNQLPEYQRLLSTHSSWNGELCWILPPSTLKWLKIGFHPVKNKLNDVENWIIFANDISTMKHLIQRNEQLALQDMLTKLPNRFAFWQMLEKHIATKCAFYLLYIDINDFRRHNEFYGHDEGDKLLIELSKRIRVGAKATDYFARVGGDEFAIIINNIDSKQACTQVIDRLLTQLARPFYTEQGEHYNVTISIGAACCPIDAVSAEELMKIADLSAYSGKNKKQNAIQFYSTSLRKASFSAIQIERELRQAIKHQEFELYLQPIIDVKTNHINKAEALLRWHHPKQGLISPEHFITIAEKTGLIINIGEWVIERTCQIAKQISELGVNLKISMNLSPSQVADDNLYNHLTQCIEQTQIDASLLELEITEGVLVDDYIVAEQLLKKVRALGISISVDDFGTGYSSLVYLKKLPLDFLKIDRTFIKEIVTDEHDKAIVRAVIGMAHTLNLCVIAEGVETEEQLSFLVNNACNSVQGFIFSRPIQLQSFITLLQQQNQHK